MSRVYIFNYNNYFNRMLKIENSISAYKTASGGASGFRVFDDINFNVNDGVNTIQTINYDAVYTDINPDYLIVADKNDNIISRWFIIENTWNRKNQSILTLRRDLLADFKDEYYEKPFFCEKGIVPMTDDFIFNGENIRFNQVLKARQRILDNSSTKTYAVGFVANNTAQTQISIDNYPRHQDAGDFPFYDVYVKEAIDDSGYSYTTKSGHVHLIATQAGASQGAPQYFDCDIVSNGISTATYHTGTDIKLGTFGFSYNVSQASIFSQSVQSVSLDTDRLDTGIKLVPWNTDWDSYNDYVYYDISQQGYYKISITNQSKTIYVPVNDLNGGYISTLAKEVMQNLKSRSLSVNDYLYDDGAPLYMYANRSQPTYISFTYKKIRFNKYNPTSFTYPSQTATLSSGQPYNIFFAEVTAQNKKTLMKIGSQLNSLGYLYDYQLFPYLPQDTTGLSTTVVDADTTLYWATENTNNFTTSITNPCYEGHTMTAKEMKRHSISTFVRLTAPDESSSYDFCPVKCGITGNTIPLNVFYSLIPFNTVIRVYPNWSRLYGIQTAGDNRGLIYKGDFSFPRSTNQWEQYKANNKSYQDAFDRQVQNIETTQSIQRTQEIWGIASGVVGGATSGAMTGAMVGGGTGAIVGGAIGGITTLAGGIADYQMNEKLRNEALDYTKDMFSFNMQNIIARPDTLTTSGTSSVTNHIFPSAMTYKATDDEITAWEDKALYNGWTIGRIGTFKEFNDNKDNSISRYIKGKIIRMDTINDDTHLLNEIANELFKGVYSYI